MRRPEASAVPAHVAPPTRPAPTANTIQQRPAARTAASGPSPTSFSSLLAPLLAIIGSRTNVTTQAASVDAAPDHPPSRKPRSVKGRTSPPWRRHPSRGRAALQYARESDSRGPERASSVSGGWRPDMRRISNSGRSGVAGLFAQVPGGKGVLWSLSDRIEKLVGVHVDPRRNQPSG
jgi:hypothetical protein